MRPSISSVEFLLSETGKEFARGLVQSIAALPQPPLPAELTLEPEEQFEEFVDDFLEFVKQYNPAENFRPHLESVYRDRFLDMCPPAGEARTAYYFAVYKVMSFLSVLTGNVWKLDTGVYPGYPNPRERQLSLYHLQWAREAFGWWRANVEKLPYYLELKRPCKTPTLDAMHAALGDALIAQLPRRDKREVENGCPIC